MTATIKGSCHCGAVKLEVAEAPAKLTDCNCSLCRRVGGLWAYYQADQVKVEGSTVAYIQGDRTVETHHCPACGCVTHWSGLGEHAARAAVNFAMMPPQARQGVRVRHFDGADTWTFLD